jgi:hypothetical protein
MVGNDVTVRFKNETRSRATPVWLATASISRGIEKPTEKFRHLLLIVRVLVVQFRMRIARPLTEFGYLDVDHSGPGFLCQNRKIG